MSQLLLCNSAITSNALENTFGITTDSITGVGCANPNILNAYHPYLATDNKKPTAEDFAILTQFSNAAVTKELTHLSLSYGVDNTLALAEISDKLKNSGIGMMGASTSIYGNRLASFTDAVKNYQSALMNYREVMKSGAAAKTLAKQNVIRAFQKMQVGFKHELNSVTAGIKASGKGHPLTNSTRGMNIAKSSRTAIKLDINSQVQASQLARFGKSAKFLGNGLAVIDFASRIGNIQNSYNSGEEWERELFIESSSFALSAATGVAAINVGSAALGFLMVATPIGWVGLIVGGIAVAGVAAGSSMWINDKTKKNSGSLYDDIMSWL
jgi:hypothetical protein